MIADDCRPMRLGYALGNEFSDHVTSVTTTCGSRIRNSAAALGPELLLGDLPEHVEGRSRILRDGRVIWEKPFLSGQANMSQSPQS